MQLQKKFLKRIFILGSTSFIVSVIIFLSGILKLFEFKVYDLLSIYINPPNISDRVCLIYVDQNSITELSKQGITWPWPRQIYAPVIEYLSEADAIFLDILFTENSSYGVEDDKILGDAIKKTKNVYLPLVLSKEEKIFINSEEKYLKNIPLKISIPPRFQYNSIGFPVDEVRENAKGLGSVSILPDEDGVYRRIPLFFKVREYTIPNFIMSYFVNKNAVKFKNDKLFINNAQIALKDGSVLLKYSTHKQPFTVLPFIEIFDASVKASKNQDTHIKKNFFKDKVVFIGLTAAGLFDLKPMPVSSTTPGLFIHATAFENIMNKNSITTAPAVYIFIFILFISYLIPYIVLKQHSLKINILAFIILLLTIVLLGIFLFRISIYLQLTPMFVSLVFTSITSSLYSYAVEGRERSFIKRTFTQYMDSRIVDYLLKNPEYIKPGGQKKTVTVFFADIADFTTISESLSPEKTAFMLHQVLDCLSKVIIEHYGIVDKYIGDCIMAFWGAPVQTPEDETNACNTAIKCIEKLKEINKELTAKGIQGIKIRIGIHTGDAIVGNIGSDRLFNYTVVGDTVNIASRLESVNKYFKTSIIVSEDTMSKISDNFIARELGLITVKGKTKPIRIFELIGKKNTISDKQEILLQKYNSGFKLYNEKKWFEARDVFSSILKDFPEDEPSKFYMKKCEDFISGSGLTKDWHIIKMEEK